MAATVRDRLSASIAALGRAFANPGMRRLQLAAAGSMIGSWAYQVALAVYAYDVGGAGAVGLAALLRFVPSAIASPFTAMLGDRFRRVRVMVASDLIRAAAMALGAAAIAIEASPALVFFLAALTTVTGTAFPPAQRALLPGLARSPEELTAANVATSTIESAGVFVGPALGGLLLAVSGPEVVFAANGLSFLWSAVLVARVPEAVRERPERRDAASKRRFGRDATAGVRVLLHERSLALVVLLTAAQTLVFGALTVLVVVLALELLDTGAAGVGFLNSALGVGGLLGSFAAFALIGRPRLAGGFALGIALWGLPLVAVGIWPQPVLALLLFGVIGTANTLVDVSGLTLLQRTVADDVLARVFGVLQGLMTASIGLGAIIAPVLISAFGARVALVITGSSLPLLAVLTWRYLRTVDARSEPAARELELLRALPLFAPLPVATLEHLAAHLERVDARAGERVVRAGDPGDRFYVIGAGEVDVVLDGKPASVLGPGDHFGEIALLRDVPRTATVVARDDAELYALGRDEFVAAVTGHAASAEAADAVVGARLGTMRAGSE